MEVLMFVVLGLVGGAVAAVVLGMMPRRRSDSVAAEASGRHELDSPAINYSSLKVSGVGGLGLVVVCIAIAIALPDIRRSMTVAVGLGVVLGGALVYWRRKSPLPSSGARPGANTTLAIDSDGDPDGAKATGERADGPQAMIVSAPVR